MPLTVSNPSAIAIANANANAIRPIAVARMRPSPFSRAIYGDPTNEIDDLIESIRQHGVLVPLVVVPLAAESVFEVVSGHRRLACARSRSVRSSRRPRTPTAPSATASQASPARSTSSARSSCATSSPARWSRSPRARRARGS